LFSVAELLVFPSLSEGFGLPPLEAMACGTPVVCSNTTALPEVVGEAALLIDPLNVSTIAEAMLRVLTESDLAEVLRNKGFQRAEAFTWKRTAEQTLGVYQSALA
jgi:alpha-1,3-rhamnosyl/mannosyltransferase